MTKIIYWNIQQFSKNKINNPSTAVSTGQGGRTNAQASADRYFLLWQHIQFLKPDILVIVEVSSGSQDNGRLVTPSLGRSGCLWLASQLRGLRDHDNGGYQRDWRLVPPLQVGIGGVTESVAVFYRGLVSDGVSYVGDRFFTGPNIWSGGAGGTSIEPGLGVAADYPPALEQYLLEYQSGLGRRVPDAAQHNGGADEEQLAARIKFRDTAGGGGPGNLINFGHYRPPYMCTFTETDHTDTVVKDLSVFAVHAPPRGDLASLYLTNMSFMHDLSRALGALETRAICGDFNLNLLKADGTNANRYAALQAIGYTPQLDAPANPVGPLGKYRGYFATHIKPRKKSVLWSKTNTQPPYPGYGYIGSGTAKNLFSIDNILTRGGAPADFTIINSVVNSPLDEETPPAGVDPGTEDFFNDFNNKPAALNWPTTPNAPPTAPGLASSLRSWPNYGHIYSTSDHFALYTVV